ncbi:glucan synthase like 7 [Planoprotostelium fungivorum]|uniref:Glucan synthase like 7 n=1 Tax=Planoprotostelium fungivorum TaxID=1890364 RepID=A0A2P6N859_9EUKA|nr:glucan synthase like 7 [Planoprotostelium fungivorum]
MDGIGTCSNFSNSLSRQMESEPHTSLFPVIFGPNGLPDIYVHSDAPIDLTSDEEVLLNTFEEIVTYRTIVSLVECLSHSPHKVHQLYHLVQQGISQHKSPRQPTCSRSPMGRIVRRKDFKCVQPWDKRKKDHWTVQWNLMRQRLIEGTRDGSTLVSNLLCYHSRLMDGYQCWREANHLSSSQSRDAILNASSVRPHVLHDLTITCPDVPSSLCALQEAEITTGMMSLLDLQRPTNYDDISWWSLFDLAGKPRKLFLEPSGFSVVWLLLRNFLGILDIQWFSFLLSVSLYRYNHQQGNEISTDFLTFLLTVLSTFTIVDTLFMACRELLEMYTRRVYCDILYSSTLPKRFPRVRLLLYFFSLFSTLAYGTFREYSSLYWGLRLISSLFSIAAPSSLPMVSGRTKDHRGAGTRSSFSSRLSRWFFIPLCLTLCTLLQLYLVCPTLHSIRYRDTCSLDKEANDLVSKLLRNSGGKIVDVLTGNGGPNSDLLWICTIGHWGLTLSVLLSCLFVAGVSFSVTSVLYGFFLGAWDRGLRTNRSTTLDLQENIENMCGYFCDERERREDMRKLWMWYVTQLRSYDHINDVQVSILTAPNGDIDLNSHGFSTVARETILFWKRSVSRKKEGKFPAWEDVPCVSTIVPCFDETLIAPDCPDELTQQIDHLRRVYPEEWDNFSERTLRTVSTVMKNAFARGDFRSFREKEEKLWLELRLWVSYRSQTVIRTIRGAHSYGDALVALCSTVYNTKFDGNSTEISKKHQVLLAHQTFTLHHQKFRGDFDVMMKLFPRLEIVINWEMDADRDRSTQIRDLSDHLSERFNLKDLDTLDPTRSYASILLRSTTPSLVLPRRYPLLVAGTQGKAANQRNALIKFTENLALDCNQDAFSGECLKLPLVLEKLGMKKDIPDHRIVGFSESVFTEKLSLVGKFHAEQEMTFNSISQRLYTFMQVRMHYGHPDVFDAGWALSVGLSKASAKINLSEDIFAGFEVKNRRESVSHVEGVCRVQKGRETNMTGVTKFETKISEGAASIFRSRDLFEMMSRLSLPEQFMVFYSSVGYFLTNSLLVHTTHIYLSSMLLVFLSLFFYGNGTNKVEVVDPLSVFVLGWVSVSPLAMETIINRGLFDGLFSFFEDLPLSVIFHVFQSQTKHCAFSDSLFHGNARYRRTGRNLGNHHETYTEIYGSYAKSHFHPAFQTITCLIVGLLLSASAMANVLPVFYLTVTVVCFLFAPVLFNPRPDRKKSQREFFEFSDAWLKGNLLEDFWYEKEKQDFSFPVGKSNTEPSTTIAGVSFHVVRTFIWLSLLVQGYQTCQSWLFAIVVLYLGFIMMRLYNKFLFHIVFTLGVITWFVNIFLESSSKRGTSFALTSLCSTLFIVSGQLSSVRFLWLHFAARNHRKDEEAFSWHYRWASRTTGVMTQRWIEAAGWLCASTMLDFVWSPFSDSLLFGKSFNSKKNNHDTQ